MAHYSQIALRGVGNTAPTPIQTGLNSVGYAIGGGWKPGSWDFRASAYSGTGLGQIFGDLSQFADIKDSGGYLQGGYNFTSHWSAHATYASSKPHAGAVIRWLGNGSTGLLKSRQAALDLEYASGAYAFGVQWIHATLDSTTNGANRSQTGGNQLSISSQYNF